MYALAFCGGGLHPRAPRPMGEGMTKTEESRTSTLVLYVLKQEYQDLFQNLAKGEALALGDAFKAPFGRKSFQSEEEAARRASEMKGLIEAGFVTPLD